MIPLSIGIEITDYCNCNCSYCFNESRNSKNLSFDDFSRIVLFFEKLGTIMFCISGGEPLLNPEFQEICTFLAGRKAINKQLYTNGKLIKQKANEINHAFDIVNINLATITAQKSGVYSLPNEVIDDLLLIRIPKILVITLTNKNQQYISNFIQFGEKVNASSILFMFVKSIGFGCIDTSSNLTIDEKIKVHKKISKLKSITKMQITISNPFLPCCSGGQYFIEILPNGNVKKCAFTQETFGNLLKEDISSILNKISQGTEKCKE